MKLYDDYILLLDSTNNLILTQIQMKEEKVEDLKFVSLLKKISQDLNMICFHPFGISHFYFDGNDINIKYNELN